MSQELAQTGPTVSVIIPTFNREKFIGDAVQSVLAQTFHDFEVIVVDDGSSDRTVEIVKAVATNNVKYVWQPNRGRSNARNHGLRLAAGRYISFLDSDDLYLPEKLELQVAYLGAHPEVDMVYTSACCIDESGVLLDHIYEASASGSIYGDIAFFVPVTITLPTVMIRREVLDNIGGFDEHMERFEDTDMWRRIAKHYQIWALRERTCKLRTHRGNTLFAQNPQCIVAALDYYIEKVFREDQFIDSTLLRVGAFRLYEHYAKALMTNPAWIEMGRKLLSKASHYFSPKVSLVIPVFNGSDYLREAIDSALGQTYNNIEFVVVNDGSTDGGATEQIALSYGERIRYFSKENGGSASALNKALAEMTGEYFSWLSHDDLYCQNKVETQVRALTAMEQPARTIVYSDYAVFSGDPRSAVPVRLPHVPPEQFRYFITVNNSLHGCTLLVPKSAFEECGQFNESLRTTPDYDLWFRLAEKYRFVHIPEVLVKARSHADQGSIRMKSTALTECNALLAHFVARLSEAEIIQATNKRSAHAYFGIASNLRRRGFELAASRAAELAWGCLRKISTLEEAYLLLKEAHCELEVANRQLEVANRQLEVANRQLEEANIKLAHLQSELEKTHQTVSWRVTGPLRAGRRALRLLLARFRAGN